MKMNSLKETSADFKSPKNGAESDEFYPSLYLSEKHIKSLGLDKARVKDELTLVAKVRVSSLSEQKNGMSSMTLEVIEAVTTPKADPETALYGKS